MLIADTKDNKRTIISGRMHKFKTYVFSVDDEYSNYIMLSTKPSKSFLYVDKENCKITNWHFNACTRRYIDKLKILLKCTSIIFFK